MNPYILSVLLVFSFISKSSAQAGLSWADFKGPIPDTPTSTVARIQTGISITYEWKHGHYEYIVLPVIYQDESWVKIKTAYGLKHENTHFLICRLVCLWGQKEMKKFSKSAPVPDIQKIVDHFSAVANQMNEDFDSQSVHGQNIVEEKRWEKMISTKLRSLE